MFLQYVFNVKLYYSCAGSQFGHSFMVKLSLPHGGELIAFKGNERT